MKPAGSAAGAAPSAGTMAGAGGKATGKDCISVMRLQLLPGPGPVLPETDYQFFTDAPDDAENPNDREKTMDVTRPGPAMPAPPAPRDAALMARAKELEAAFLAEMLDHAGMSAESGGAFGGGIGEEQFASFLRQEEARMLVERGGIGLAESLFRAMGGGQGNG